MDCTGMQVVKVYFFQDFSDLCLSALSCFSFLGVPSFGHLDFLYDLCALERELDSLAESNFFFTCWLWCRLPWEPLWGTLWRRFLVRRGGGVAFGEAHADPQMRFQLLAQKKYLFQAFSPAISSAVVSAHNMVHV